MCLDKLHPLVGIFYFALVITLLVCSFNPVMGFIGLFTGVASMLVRRSKKNIKMVLIMAVPSALFLIIIQPLFSHNGETPLFYVNDMAVTYETVVFGIAAFFLLIGAIAWILVLGESFTEEKLMYLFGKLTPRLTLLFSMSIRLLADMTTRYEQIVQARTFLGMRSNDIKEKGTRLATLTEWSLENSASTAQSMEARGYGRRRRTSFHMFKFRVRDGITLAAFTAVGAVCFAEVTSGSAYVSFFPALKLESVTEPGLRQILLYSLYLVLCVYGCVPAKGRNKHD